MFTIQIYIFFNFNLERLYVVLKQTPGVEE